MKKIKTYTKKLTVMITPEQFEKLKAIRTASNKTLSVLIRESIEFNCIYFNIK